MIFLFVSSTSDVVFTVSLRVNFYKKDFYKEDFYQEAYYVENQNKYNIDQLVIIIQLQSYEYFKLHTDCIVMHTLYIRNKKILQIKQCNNISSIQ